MPQDVLLAPAPTAIHPTSSKPSTPHNERQLGVIAPSPAGTAGEIGNLLGADDIHLCLLLADRTARIDESARARPRTACATIDCQLLGAD